MRVAPWQQTNWDARAAGNFIGGGSGAALLACATLAENAATYRLMAGVGLILVALGLLCVLAEIGRPLRSMNVLRHAQTSWMTREAIVAPFLFAAGAAAIIAGGGDLGSLAALLGMGYLYCQARMLQAAKGIPAWRHAKSIPLMIGTGLVEGAGLAALIWIFAGSGAIPNWTRWLLLMALIGRRMAWRSYYEALDKEGAPQQAMAALCRLRGPFENIGQTLPELLLLVAIVYATEQVWPIAAAALIGILAGWWLKLSLVTKAAYNQGFALPVLPVRGQGKGLPGVKPGWK